MSQFYSGQHGQLLIKPSARGTLTKVGNLKDWSINFQMPVLETTCLEDTDRTIIHGVRSFNGTSSLLYYQENNSNVKLMINEFIYEKSNQKNYTSKTYGQNDKPEFSNIVLRLWDGNNRDFNFHCLITSFEISCSVGDVVSASIGFEGHGLPTNMSMIT